MQRSRRYARNRVPGFKGPRVYVRKSGTAFRAFYRGERGEVSSPCRLGFPCHKDCENDYHHYKHRANDGHDAIQIAPPNCLLEGFVVCRSELVAEMLVHISLTRSGGHGRIRG